MTASTYKSVAHVTSVAERLACRSCDVRRLLVTIRQQWQNVSLAQKFLS